MDRNSAIGLTLIAILLLVYFNFFSPAPQPEESPATTTLPQQTHPSTPVDTVTLAVDSAKLIQYGALATLLQGEEKSIQVENADLRMAFSTKGGIVKELELKKFKTYYQQPLYLVQPGTNTFSLITQYEGKDIDLYAFYYEASTREVQDSTQLIFTARMGDGAYIRQTYTVPPSGYQIGYRIETKGVNNLSSDYFILNWRDQIPAVEKDINDTRNKTTITYYSAAGEYDELSEASQDTETEVFANPMKWVTIKQKFFLSGIIAKSSFPGGEVRTSVNPSDTTTIKDASVRLIIPKAEVASTGAQFTYFFGPNKYSITSKIDHEFNSNLYLGWPPVKWVNKFLILPIFKFLERFIGSYGVIIMILVLIIKIILLPLSYKSYMGMAKMKLLKPELDVIKEKYGDNMTQIQQEQLKLYQQAGVSPFSGCIPLLLQMPILFAMFYFFPVSIELRQASFLWAEDLSTYDSILNLPFTIPFYGSHVSLFVLLMTASTMIYTWQNNQISSVQGPMKTMSLIMPVIFMFVLNSFAAALSFYYFVSNLVTFAQQAIIKRFVDEDKIKKIMDEHKKKIASGGGKQSKFMAKLQEAMKASEEAKRKGK